MTVYPPLQLFINGTWRTSEKGESVFNPSDETVLGRLPHATQANLDEAIAAAEKGFRTWRFTSPAVRCQIMMRAAEILRERTEDIAVSMTLEQGKPIQQSRLEVERACSIIEWDANEGRRMYGRIIPGAAGFRHMVIREPIGVVAAFSPWNFPISSPARKVAGALAAGCSIILKASEETPASAMHLVRAFVDAGLPVGALNLVFGIPEEISKQLVAHPSIRLVTLTGSVPVGKRVAALAGLHMKRSIMELGGHAPVIVCEDADPDATAFASVAIKTRNAGQVCVGPTRFYVHCRIYDRFIDQCQLHASNLKIGEGIDPSYDMGPLANPRRIEAMEMLVKDAVDRGAKLIFGGNRIPRAGYFYPLTVLSDVPPDARAMQEEPFGPLLLIIPFENIDEAITKANSLPFGLAAYAFTESSANAAKIADGIECGNISINHFVASLAETPFGGVKDSGYGREGGIEGLEEYTFVKMVSHFTKASNSHV